MYCGLAWLPLCTAGIGLATILITYMLAVANEHIQPVLPYISDTGIEYPESSVFSLCMDIVAFLLVLTVYVSHQLIGQFSCCYGNLDKRYQILRRVNGVGLIVGIIAAGGLIILANFPEDENLPIHLMGAFFCFTFGVVYCFLHSWLSFKISPEFVSPWICFLRLALATFSALTLALCILFGGVLRWNANEENPQPFYKKISAVFEWTLVVTLDLYFATFAVEFRRLKMTHTFEHYKEGSWAEFPAIIRRSGSTSQSEDTASTKSSYLANSNYIINYDVKNICQHNNGRTHTLPSGEWCIGWATTV
ncbi:DNA damage-regulated autophagy modulator protein 1-like [Amphiura filiformis]|uniref:DNA damage-regulated autophagy modulator protein 1-like n=1 Tax=Amphiura filiformis TaxID=82378 RepID=UPI003B21FF7D